MSVFKELLAQAIEKDSTWVPKIYTDIQPPYFLANAYNGDKNDPQTDIVAYLRKPDATQQAKLTYNLCYPNDCVYRFDRFQGLRNKDSLCEYLCRQATKSSATKLVKGATNESPGKKFKLSVRLQCQHYRKSEAHKRFFNDKRFQQPGTYEQQENKSSSVKGKSSSASKQLTPRLDGSYSYLQFNKSTSHRPLHECDKCKFALHLVCSATDEHWYLRHNSARGIKSSINHKGHLPIDPKDVESDVNNMSQDALQFMRISLETRVPIPQIVQMLSLKYGLTVSESVLYNERSKVLYKSFSITNDQERMRGTEVDQLLAEFLKDVSYIYVLHEKKIQVL